MNSPIISTIWIPKSELAEFCRSHGIRKLALFGSALGPRFKSTSDVDLLVEFESNRVPGLLGIASMETELSSLFGGRRIDLRTSEDLSPYFRQDVLESAEVQYVQE